ncbi:3-dehydroquinate synthase [Pseudoneobacillus sp. C159]
MEKIQIITESKEYPVIIGKDAVSQLPEILDGITSISKIVVITDQQVHDLYISSIIELIKPYEFTIFITPVGEAAKTFEVYYEAQGFLLEHKLDRDSLLIAFGGGAIGDLGGFIASTFMRGIRFIQVPTTILAHDSAVGGKVAINHPVGKNMIGSFYQPEAVIYDVSFFNSLSLSERQSGFAELIKHSLIAHVPFYEQLKADIQTLESFNLQVFQRYLIDGIKVKSEFVALDEKEKGQRAYLNFGHTLGHAIEAEAGYGKITHGQAVIFGMIFALHLSEELENLSFELNQFTNWLDRLGYRTKIPSFFSREVLINRMRQDKKASKQEIRMVLLSKVGEPITKTVSEDILLRTLNNMYE